MFHYTCITKPAANKALVHIGSCARAEPSFSNARWWCPVVMYNNPNEVASLELSGYHLINIIKVININNFVPINVFTPSYSATGLLLKRAIFNSTLMFSRKHGKEINGNFLICWRNHKKWKKHLATEDETIHAQNVSFPKTDITSIALTLRLHYKFQLLLQCHFQEDGSWQAPHKRPLDGSVEWQSVNILWLFCAHWHEPNKYLPTRQYHCTKRSTPVISKLFTKLCWKKRIYSAQSEKWQAMGSITGV